MITIQRYENDSDDTEEDADRSLSNDINDEEINNLMNVVDEMDGNMIDEEENSTNFMTIAKDKADSILTCVEYLRLMIHWVKSVSFDVNNNHKSSIFPLY